MKTWLDKFEISIVAASEPSDYIWENRHYSDWDRRKKEIIVWSILFFLLVISFCIIFVFTLEANTLLNKFPYVDCTQQLGYGNEEILLK